MQIAETISTITTSGKWLSKQLRSEVNYTSESNSLRLEPAPDESRTKENAKPHNLFNQTSQYISIV